MANIEIAGKDFMNYTDLREKNKLAAIEVEMIQSYAKSLMGEQMKIFLGEVSDADLILEIDRRLCSRKNSLEYGERSLKGWR